jgi:hypothetical protein
MDINSQHSRNRREQQSFECGGKSVNKSGRLRLKIKQRRSRNTEKWDLYATKTTLLSEAVRSNAHSMLESLRLKQSSRNRQLLLKSLKRAGLPGPDIYAMTATRALASQRQYGKSLRFAQMYGSSPEAVDQMIMNSLRSKACLQSQVAGSTSAASSNAGCK